MLSFVFFKNSFYSHFILQFNLLHLFQLFFCNATVTANDEANLRLYWGIKPNAASTYELSRLAPLFN